MTKRFIYKPILLAAAALLFQLLLARSVSAFESYIDVGITKHERVSSATVETSALNVYTDIFSPPIGTLESAAGFMFSSSGSGVALSRGGETLFVSDGPLLVQGVDGTSKIGGISYRGFLRAQRTGASITIVNVIDTEHYLYGVVPAEMPASWHIEALKAQAVAARSYAATQAGVHADRGFDVCDTTCCQYYPGMSMETETSTQAVNQTAGMMAYYNGEPINAVFASSSGGHTENSENVWSETLGYLRGVKETNENEFMEWSRTYTLAELSAGLAAKGANVGTVTSVTVEYFPSGRLSKLTFSGTGGSRTYEKDAIRGVTSEMGGSLPSALFKINGYAWSQNGVWDGGGVSAGAVYVLSASGTSQRSVSDIYAEGSSGSPVKPSTITALGGTLSSVLGSAQGVPSGGQNTFTISSNTIVLEGRGYGHGAGMSQYGAKGMAEAGFDFISILKHYYTGIEVY